MFDPTLHCRLSAFLHHLQAEKPDEKLPTGATAGCLTTEFGPKPPRVKVSEGSVRSSSPIFYWGIPVLGHTQTHLGHTSKSRFARVRL